MALDRVVIRCKECRKIAIAAILYGAGWWLPDEIGRRLDGFLNKHRQSCVSLGTTQFELLHEMGDADFNYGDLDPDYGSDEKTLQWNLGKRNGD